MTFMLQRACENALITDVSDLEGMNTIQRDEIFTKVFNELNKQLLELKIQTRASRRVGELKIFTYYNDISKLKKTLLCQVEES
jgi:hypothetical protein